LSDTIPIQNGMKQEVTSSPFPRLYYLAFTALFFLYPQKTYNDT
jgi:hypothetical protein